MNHKKQLLILCCIGFSIICLRSQDQSQHLGLFNVVVVPSRFDDAKNGASQVAIQNQNISIHELNNILKSKGFVNVLDYSTYLRVAKERILLSNEQSLSSSSKTVIQNAPVDLIIEMDLVYLQPPNSPQNQQVLINLKAIDRYNANIYATATLSSKQRNFPSFQKALQTTLTIDAVVEINKFFEELQRALDDVIKNGRLIKLKFEIANESPIRFLNKIGEDSIADQIENFIKSEIAQDDYRVLGQSADYMDFSLRISTLDSEKHLVTITSLRRSLDIFFQKIGVKVKDIFSLGAWINCIIK